MLKTKAALALAVLLAASAVATVLVLERRANDSKQAQLTLANVKLELSRLQMAPFRANPRIGGSPVVAKKMMDDGKASIRRSLETLGHESEPAAIDQVRRRSRRITPSSTGSTCSVPRASATSRRPTGWP